MNLEVGHVLLIGADYGLGKPGVSGYGHKEVTVYLVEALDKVSCSAAEWRAFKGPSFDAQGEIVPSIFGTSGPDPCKELL